MFSRHLFFILFFTLHYHVYAADYHQHATAILTTAALPIEYPSIIDQHEWQELQLDRFVVIADRTKTAFGRWGLTHLLHPIAHSQELANRHAIISFLVEHEDLLEQLQKALLQLKAAEHALLSYWDVHDKLTHDVAQFYYTIPELKNSLNDNSVALEGGVLLQALSVLLSLLQSLCLNGLYTESIGFLLNPQQNEFSLSRGLKIGFQKPLLMHMLEPYIFKDSSVPFYSFKEFAGANFAGSIGDRYKMLTTGVALPFNNITCNKLSAALLALVPTIVHDITWAHDLRTVIATITTMHTLLNELQHRIVNVARCFKTIMQVNNMIVCTHNNSLLSLWDTYAQVDTQAASCIQELQKDFFAQKCSYFYSRGRVLQMHLKIQNIKQHFVPLLQTIGLLDAYCSIAQLYKEHKNNKNRFCFVHFVDQEKPLLHHEDAWLPLLSSNSSVNNVICCDNTHSHKIIITGPNGGGKSVYLKMVGYAALLAQSWTIVPALTARQSLFTHICTGLAPHEDLSHSLSTFMAEKKRMQELKDIILRSNKHNHALIVIDEPYRGTVDDESAKRIYAFGKDIASAQHALVYIATHVKKPINLAQDTHGLFTNYHVKINELTSGTFERTFKLIQGPALWWFEDEEMRSRFIDWIG